MNPVVEIFKRLSPLGEPASKAFEGILETRFYPKNEPLLQIGRVPEHFYFVVQGLARVYYLHNGNDVTDYFARENEFIGAVPALLTGTTSHKAIETLEDSEIIRFRFAEFEQLCLHHHDLERASRRMLTFGFLELQERMEKIRLLSARERYFDLERQYPGITNRIPLKHLASFIGTTPVSLSRIRAGKQ